MKLLMLGTGPFAVPTFRDLLAGENPVVGLVTRPAHPSQGRARIPPSPMRVVAHEAGLPVYDPQDINSTEGLELLRRQQVDLLVVCDYGQILSTEALGTAPLGGINLHGSLLPQYRGAAPVHWALLRGDTQTGVTVIHMTRGLDAGPVLARRIVEIPSDEDAVHLEQRLSLLGPAAVRESIAKLAEWDRRSPIGEPQRRELVSTARRLRKSDGQVCWNWSAARIRDQVRALKPWPGTFTHLLRDARDPIRVILNQVSVSTREPDVPPGGNAQPGVGMGSGPEILVWCGEGVLAIQRLQPAGKRDLEAAEFLRGYGSAGYLRFGSA